MLKLIISTHRDHPPVFEQIQLIIENFNEGLKLATEKRRPVVMDFYADWCGWCRKMEAEVFNDPEVATKLRNDYICIRLHTDRNYNETIKYKNHVLTKQEFTSMLGVQGLPTVVFL